MKHLTPAGSRILAGLAAFLAALAFACLALAQGVETTTVQGTVYLANGQPGSGSVQISWPAFTTSSNLAVAAGRLNAAIGADGLLSVNLAPNLGASPAGLFYTAVYHMSDGATSTEYWIVPASPQAALAQVRAQVMPAAQAVQAASKAYVDQAIQTRTSGALGGTVNTGATGQIAYYNANGSALSGLTAVPVTAGGTGATSASAALAVLGAAALNSAATQSFSGSISAPRVNASVNGVINVMAPPYNAKGDCATDDNAAITAALRAADALASGDQVPPTVVFPQPPGGCYLTSTLLWLGESLAGDSNSAPGTTPQDGASVIIKGMPGQDILHAPDPSTTAYPSDHPYFNSAWNITGISFLVDNSTAGTFPHRWPGRWFDDAAMTGGSAVLTTTNAMVTCADIGSAVRVNGAGAGGSNLVTTIASVTPCWNVPNDSQWQIITLAANASTTVTNAHAYISVVNLPVTTTLGNAAIAFDDMDGDPSHFINAAPNNLEDELRNVGFATTDGANGSNSVGLYTQGVWQLYGVTARNLNFRKLDFGIVLGASELNTFKQSHNGDFEKFYDMSFGTGTKFPWISYNGQYDEIHRTQLITDYGPIIFQLKNQYYDTVQNWKLDIPEFEGDSSGYGFQIAGRSLEMTIDMVGAVGSTANIMTDDARCISCGPGLATTLNLGGSGNRFDMGKGDLNNTTVNDVGLNNQVYSQYQTNPSYGIPAAADFTSIPLKSRDYVRGKFGFDFLDDGNTTPYNKNDLFLWPQDELLNAFGGSQSYGSYVKLDPTSPTGAYMNFASGNYHQYFFPFRTASNSTAWPVIGTSFPAVPATIYFQAKCLSGSSFQMSIGSAGTPGGTIANTPTLSCSTSYANYSVAVDMTSWSGGKLYFVSSSGTFQVAWIYIRPQLATISAGQYNVGNTPLAAAHLSNGATGSGAVVLASGPTFTGNTTTFANNAAAEQDILVKPGSTADQIGALAFANYSGAVQWKLRKDAGSVLRFTDSVNSLDRAVFTQNGQTILNAGNGANAVVLNGSANAGTGGLLVQNGGASPATVFTVTGTGNATATGFVTGRSYAGSGAMTLAAGSAAGTSPTIACASGHVCDGVSGDVALTTGSSPATGTLATLTFPSARAGSASCVVAFSSTNAQLTTVTWSESTTALTLTANSALTASTAYQIRYWCGGN